MVSCEFEMESVCMILTTITGCEPVPIHVSSHPSTHQACDSPVKSIVRVPSLPQPSVESVRDVRASHLALIVDLGDVDLHRGVVLGRDETVRGGALAGDVEVYDLALHTIVG
jgi:hypothetical protein